MTFSAHHDLQPLWDLAGGQIKIKALEIALSTLLFDALVSPCTAEQIAQKRLLKNNATLNKALKLNIKNTEVWLDLLWSIGCLDKTGDNEAHYTTSDMAQRYLVKSSPLDCSQAISFRFQALKKFSDTFEDLLYISDKNLDENLDKKPHNSAYLPTKNSPNIASLWAKAAKEQIFQEQNGVTVPTLNMIMSHIVSPVHELPKNMHFLDLGSGPGLVAVALAERFEKATGVVFDFPETVKVAHENILKAGLQNRLSIQSGDFNTVQPEGHFDLIWCSSVLHFLEDTDAVIACITKLLKPNGIILLLHAEQTLDKDHCSRVLPFYLPMIMKGNYLPKKGELPKILTKYGINLITSKEISSFPMAPIWLRILMTLITDSHQL